MNTAGENRRATFNVVIIWLRDQDKRGSEDNNGVMCQLAVVCGGVCEALYNVHSGFEVSQLWSQPSAMFSVPHKCILSLRRNY